MKSKLKIEVYAIFLNFPDEIVRTYSMKFIQSEIFCFRPRGPDLSRIVSELMLICGSKKIIQHINECNHHFLDNDKKI